MSELAYNINGEAFEVPTNATGWRVRRMRAKGAPEVVYAREGHPLVLPISAEIGDLRAEVDATGRYRLDLVDQNNKAIEGAPSGYVQVSVDMQPAASDEPSAPIRTIGTSSDHVVIEAMRMNSEIAKSVVDRFPQMLEAAAQLLRAADGAGLPAREPRALDEQGDEADDDDNDAPSGSPTFELINNLVAQVVPVIVTSLASKGMPKLGAVLDWRKASPMAQLPTTPAPGAKPVVTAPSEIPPLDPATMAKVIAIQSALTPAEATRARQLAAELSPTELRAWFDELSALAIPDAVAKLRTLIGDVS